MTLIKHAQAAMLARDALVLDLGDLRRQGEAIVAQARAKADQIVAEARTERERIVAGAAERGHAEGLACGQAEGRKQGEQAGRAEALAARTQEIETLIKRWTAAVASFESDRKSMIDAAQHDAVRLAVLIAERVTKRTIETDPGVATAQVAEALRLVLRPTGVVVAINPEDRPSVESALPSLISIIGSATSVELRDDPSLLRGSCVVRCVGSGEASGAGAGGGGEIDASIGTQLDRIAELLVPAGPSPGEVA